MSRKHTLNELNNMNREDLSTIILTMQGQLSFFDEADTLFNPNAVDPEEDEIVLARLRKKKAKGQCNIDLKDLPEEIIPTHGVSEDALNVFYGKGNWKRMSDETSCYAVR